VVPLLLGNEFIPAIIPTLVLAIGTGGLGAIYLGTSVLQAVGRPGLASMIFVIAGIVTILSLVTLVPRLGLVGGAMSSSGTYLIVGTLAFLVSRRPTRAS